MTSNPVYQTLELTPTFLRDLITMDFTASDRRRFLRALDLLDANERHPSLRLHALKGKMEGTWSVSASDELRMTFVRLDGGQKRMLSCSRHYQR